MANPPREVYGQMHETVSSAILRFSTNIQNENVCDYKYFM